MQDSLLLKPGIDQVWLMSSPLPFPMNFIAIHTWFVFSDRQNNVSRWEVWQKKSPAQQRWGYIHCNLFKPFQGIVSNPIFRSHYWHSSPLHYWEGELAIQLSQILVESSSLYPNRNKYLVWPGPNSNTYTQWILNQFSDKSWPLPKRAIGARFRIKSLLSGMIFNFVSIQRSAFRLYVVQLKGFLLR